MSVEVGGLTTAQKVAIAGGILLVVGAFLPWASVSFGGDAGQFSGSVGMSASGIDGDGVFTLALGAIVVGVVLLRNWEEIDQLGVAAAGGLSFLIGLVAFSNMGQSYGFTVDPGIGLYLTMGAALAVVVAGVQGYRTTPQPRAHY